MSVSICIPVWNRGDLLRLSFRSLLKNLDGVKADIWIFDNGSSPTTRRIVGGLSSATQRVFKVFLPINSGIPYVVNLFSALSSQPCKLTRFRPATHVMLMDADAFFKGQVRDLVSILESSRSCSIVSGHDSPEHPAHDAFTVKVGRKRFRVKKKRVERGICMLMKRKHLEHCGPFRHDRRMDVDWDLTARHLCSVGACRRWIFAVDYVAHLGLYDSTWHPYGVPATDGQMVEINEVLTKHHLFTRSRRRLFDSNRTRIVEDAFVQSPRKE